MSFNVVRVVNHSDTAVRIKPLVILPAGWMMFSPPFNDTIVMPGDSISLPFRFQLPERLSAEIKHEILFRAYSPRNKMLSEGICVVHPEAVHDWDVTLTEKRVFFYPRVNTTSFELLVQNRGNVIEPIKILIKPDNKISLTSTGGWKSGQYIYLDPYQDTVLRFNARYTFEEDRVFDMSKIQINAYDTSGLMVPRAFMIEKYNDTYAPFYVDRSLPHQTEIGFRTFSGNNKTLPFIKARGVSTFKNLSTFRYNFNYYALTGNEDFISNSYYNFLYKWKDLEVGIGAFSSQLGRNLYTRHGAMVSNMIRLSPSLGLEAFISQSFFTPKTSAAVGYTIEKEKIGLHGSFAYDFDNEKKVNTGSAMLQSELITLAKNHEMSFNLYGYTEKHYFAKDYTMAGVAWDIRYNARFGKVMGLQFVHNYGSPEIPGPQMGLLTFGVNSVFLFGQSKRYLSAEYINSSRNYHVYDIEGNKMPNIFLYDQYANILFHSDKNPNHSWQAGPSVESYISTRPSYTVDGLKAEYKTQKLRLEYKGTIYKNLILNIKTGYTNIDIRETEHKKEEKLDFHLMGGITFRKGFGMSFSYDYGPMVNSGLYQFSNDAENHSLTVSPNLMSYYFKERLSLNVFANMIYRIDLKYASFNINPKIEAYLFRDFYLVASGTYHFSHQQYPDYNVKNSYTYLELSIRKRWGKSDFNKWQRDTRRLKVILFKDDNGNGVKEDTEQGVPYVKTRLRLTNSDNPYVRTEFPVDIILLSNEAGVVNYNRIPRGFYEMTITPMTDMKEYFYVSRSAEKLELTKNATYYIPFQKATKISGKIVVTRQKFIKKGEELIDLTNIKVTAYNKQGNSYSSFTLSDGSFTIFLPGNNTYYVRMGNVFGPGYKIMQNDISIVLPDSASMPVIFDVREIGRQVKLKEAKPKPAVADTLQPEALKIKVLHGKFYENTSEAAVDKDAIPVFDIKEAPVPEVNIIPGNYYVVLGIDSTRTQAVKVKRILDENGIDCTLGYYEKDRAYYIYTKYFANRGEARKESDMMKQAGIRDAQVILFE